MIKNKKLLMGLLILFSTVFLGACNNKVDTDDKTSNTQDTNYNNAKNLSTKVTETNKKNYTIDTKASDKLFKPMEEGPMLERAKEKIGFSPSRNADSRRLNLTIETHQEDPSVLIFKVTGNGFLKFGDDQFNFKVNEERSYLNQLDNDGRPVLVGLITGTIKSKKDSTEELTINTVYYPDTNQGQYGVVVGVLGDEIIIPFGDQIVDDKLSNLIEREIYNRQ